MENALNEEFKSCRFCGEQILAVAIKCKHCGSNLQEGTEAKAAGRTDLGVVLVVLPVIGTLLLWLWVGNMSLLEGVGNSLMLVTLLTILGTASVAAYEASKNSGFAEESAPTYSSLQWFLIVTMLWIVGYPAYLLKRKYYGLKSYLLPGLVLAVIFSGTAFLLGVAVEEKKAEVRKGLEGLNTALGGLSDASSPAPEQAVAQLEAVSAPTAKGQISTEGGNVGQCLYPKSRSGADGKLEFIKPIAIVDDPFNPSSQSQLQEFVSFTIGAEASNGKVQLVAVPGWDSPPNPNAGQPIGWADIDDFEFQAFRNCN